MSTPDTSTVPPTHHFSQQDIERWLGARELAKGRGYVESVSHLHVAADHITASVQGTRPRPYQVDIRFRSEPASAWRLLPACTCPVGGHCKHTAAVLLKTLAQRDPHIPIRAEVLSWVQELRRLADAPKSANPFRGKFTPRLFYLLKGADPQGELRVECFKVRTDTDGDIAGKPQSWNQYERALTNPPAFVDEDDLGLLRLLWAQRPREQRWLNTLPIAGKAGDEILRRLLECGRWLIDLESHDLYRPGEPRSAKLSWRLDGHGRYLAQAEAFPPISRVLPLTPPWYLDLERGEAGVLEFDTPAALVKQLLTAPPLSGAEAEVVAATLAEIAPHLPTPTGHAAKLRVIDTPVVPLLRIATQAIHGMGHFRRYDNPWALRHLDYAIPAFRYGEHRFEMGDSREFMTLASGETVRIKRQPEQEARLILSLSEFGWARIPGNIVFSGRPRPPFSFGLDSEAAWDTFMADLLPRLRGAGWEVELPADFRHSFLEVEAWQAEIDEAEPGWFDLSMGIVVEGRRLPLAPLLVALFNQDSRWLDPARLVAIRPDESVDLLTPDGKRIRIPAERLKPVARTLIDLFDAGIGADGHLRIAKLDAPRLAEMAELAELTGMADLARWQFRGMDAVQALAHKLQGTLGVQPVMPPAGFALELRPYQQEGLAWLQYLRAQELSGILADDMGLGKTAQTLAHLLTEKEAGRLDRPALVVLPTSLVFNWKHEAARFAPGLKVLSLHGKDRKARFEQIAEHDVALTTYPLLWRDHEDLEKQDYHLLILDEAQTVKNAGSQAARVVRRLRARHRLCLTGTPLENHLGELWAQFDFLLPGFLGDAKAFARTWRTPIEKHGDKLRREILAKRLKPFILRRRKEEVAKELPPKTLILRTVELDGGQRDLYETVRSAMDARVREAIADQGFRRSQIVILDALLKLRQVCCDPRLVKSEVARKVKERAKLDLLMAMLPEMVEEGRRILLFSQFTSMLDLIRLELERARLGYVLLTGDTTDRETPIRRFQEDGVPLFLISLKAGGLGLNLTAADTVIHYDPWWNPAVENQATDRAHRLGQTKPVFVYKLIVAGSIEEKIIALQEKKAELAAGILSEHHAGDTKFGEADLSALLAPLPHQSG